MKFATLKSIFVGLVISISTLAHSSVITTSFNSNNAFAGNMFNVTVFDNALTFTAADLNLEDFGEDALVSVYTKLGSYSGFESNSAAWTLMGQETLTSQGNDNATYFDFSDFTLNANTVYGFYFTVSDYATSDISMRYFNGNNSYSNADLQLDLGIGLGNNDFDGSIFNSRTWSGSLYYNTAVNVSAPSTLAIFSMAILVFATRKFKSN